MDAASSGGRAHTRGDDTSDPDDLGERPAKRAKLDDNGGQPQTTAEPSADVLPLLARDVHSVHSILRALDLAGLTRLGSTCRTWRGWIERPPAHLLKKAFSLTRGRVTLTHLPSLARSTIARAYIVDLRLHAENSYPNPQATRATISGMLLALPSFARLHSLRIDHLSHMLVDGDHLRSCFSALAPRLEVLGLSPRRYDDNMTLIRVVIDSIGVLKRLKKISLDIHGSLTIGEMRQASQLDYYPLRSLPLLEEVQFNFGWFPCSTTQARVLGRCANLTSLEYGSWSASDEADDTRRQTEKGPLGALIRGQHDTMRERGLSSPSLTRIDLQKTRVSSAILNQLFQLPELTSLMPIRWSHDITPEQWARLPLAFTHLQEIGIGSLQGEGMKTDHFLPSLLQCAQLARVELWKLAFTSSQLRDLCTRLPKLIDLHFRHVGFESLQPLSEASDRLTHLKLDDCTRFEGEHSFYPLELDLRPLTALPPMRALAHLSLLRHQPSSDDTQLQIALLLERMASLTKDAVVYTVDRSDSPVYTPTSPVPTSPAPYTPYSPTDSP